MIELHIISINTAVTFNSIIPEDDKKLIETSNKNVILVRSYCCFVFDQNTQWFA